MGEGDPIIDGVLEPGLLRKCPHCLRLFGLRWTRSFPDPIVVKVEVYRCKYCGREVEFAQDPPAENE